MELNASIDYTEFSKAFNVIPVESAKVMRIALKQSCRDIQKDARLHHRFKVRSGQLERSVLYSVSGDGLRGQVMLDEGVASYGKYIHDGTDTHYVSPRKKKALYWVDGGGKFFSKGHKVRGIKPDHFLTDAGTREEPKFVAEISRAINKVIQMAIK